MQKEGGLYKDDWASLWAIGLITSAANISFTIFDISYRSAKGTLLGICPIGGFSRVDNMCDLHLTFFHRNDGKQFMVLQGIVKGHTV